MSNILEVKDISVNYGNIQALRNVSMTVEEGDIVSLIGANGAGKSTLLKAIVGLEPIVNGTISFKDTGIAAPAKEITNKFLAPFVNNSNSLPADKIAALGIALVPEGRRVFANMTVLENLEMGAYLKNDKQYVVDKIEEMYALFPILKNRYKQKAGSLSGGEQQMLAIARALMSSPRLLLLDEPGLGLAPLIIKDIFDIIKKINTEDKVTIFLVEQNAKMALSASKKGYVMETGAIVLEDESAKLLENQQVKSAYLGE